MTEQIEVNVEFPEMSLGGGGNIVASDGRVVCTMNLKDWTLTEAFAFASAFIRAGEMLDERGHK